MGRQTNTTIDVQGRVLQDQVTGLDPMNFTYDTRGRLTTTTQGTGIDERITTISYNAGGFIDSITDPLGGSVGLGYDAAGRLITQTLRDGRAINYSYDANGNVASITPPARPNHSFTYNKVNQESQYIPPYPDPFNPTPDPRTFYDYNLDKQLTLITRPDGQTVSLGYDTGGRLGDITIPRGKTTYAYDAVTGNLSTIKAPDNGAISFTYDGSLLLGSTWAGTVSGSISRTYNNDFRMTSGSVNGGNIINFQYDNDGLLTVMFEID